MYGLLVADVARQEYRDWERRFYKQVARRSGQMDAAVREPAQGLVAKLKRFF